MPMDVIERADKRYSYRFLQAVEQGRARASRVREHPHIRGSWAVPGAEDHSHENGCLLLRCILTARGLSLEFLPKELQSMLLPTQCNANTTL